LIELTFKEQLQFEILLEDLIKRLHVKEEAFLDHPDFQNNVFDGLC